KNPDPYQRPGGHEWSSCFPAEYEPYRTFPARSTTDKPRISPQAWPEVTLPPASPLGSGIRSCGGALLGLQWRTQDHGLAYSGGEPLIRLQHYDYRMIHF